MNDLPFVRSILGHLGQAGAWLVFGGWAEQLRGIAPVRAHRDVDLLVLDPDDAALAGKIEGLQVAGEATLVSYREQWAGIHAHRPPLAASQ